MAFQSKDKTFNLSKTSIRSNKTVDNSNIVCSTCKTTISELQHQVTQFKEKAHQSFMQVLQELKLFRQIQQLHDEELQEIKDEWNQKEMVYQKEIEKLKKQIEQLKNQIKMVERNMRRHSYDLGSRQLFIDNIDAIFCQQSDNSYLDQSELIQFKDLITTKNGLDYVQTLRKEVYKDFKFVSNNKTQIQKMFILMKEMKDQNIILEDENDVLKNKNTQTELQIRHLKHLVDNFNKQSKFMSDNVKRLGVDKLKLQKKINQLQKQRITEDYSKIITAKDILPSQTEQILTRPMSKSMFPFPQPQRNFLEQQEHVSTLQVSDFSHCCAEQINQTKDLNKATFIKRGLLQTMTNFKKVKEVQQIIE